MTPDDLKSKILEAHLRITEDVIGSEMCRDCEQYTATDDEEVCRLFENENRPCKWINEYARFVVSPPYMAPINNA